MSIFHFKYFSINQTNSAMKVGTDAMVFGALMDVTSSTTALDIGTGTAVLSLMNAQKNPLLRIDAIEIDNLAYQEAELNVSNSNFSKQITVIHADFLSFVFQKKYDYIFTNPPFFENSQKSKSEQKNLARHTDALPFDLLVKKVSELLNENGVFTVVLPHEGVTDFIKLCTDLGLYLNKQIAIFGKPNLLKRFVLVFSKSNLDLIEESLIVRDEKGSYTKEYVFLTKEFHGIKLKK